MHIKNAAKPRGIFLHPNFKHQPNHDSGGNYINKSYSERCPHRGKSNPASFLSGKFQFRMPLIFRSSLTFIIDDFIFFVFFHLVPLFIKKMTNNIMSWFHFFLSRNLTLTAFCRIWTTCMEFTSLWRVCRRRNRTF